MQFGSYRVHTKHRAGKPTEKASMWTVDNWKEIQLFSDASRNGWATPLKGWLWSIDTVNGMSELGVDISNICYIAKFKIDHNNEWHGYPVHPRGDDIPPDAVLESWRLNSYIDSTDKKRIRSGSFKK
ncbi:hypothetical protein RugamoR64_33080 [Duganella rhizosphaerae]